MPVVERVADSCELGEGPHWDVDTQSLYYVDIFEHSIHKYTPSTKTHTKAIVGDDTVSFIIPIEGAPNKYLISFGRQVAVISWDGVSDKVVGFKKITEVDTEEGSLENRINDAKCDPTGRLWCGTMGPEPIKGHITPLKGSFYSVDSNGEVKRHVTPVSCSNGLAWSSDGTKFYYIDSGTREIHQYDVDLSNGMISNKTVVFSFEDVSIEGFPDGQTIDTDGNLWVAVFAGYKVIKIDPRRYNTLLETIDIPSKQVTSVAFGGPNLDELYVTSASFTIDGVVLPPPNHGALYRVTGLGVKGCPGVKAKIE
ncbi:regucalcin [Holotrichia oblita]|uniref:Regucalcin n=1 Tax=Holotrichia oblita TaxID=644536 RepID=A0ACB9TBD7_HOLOL|nr:regucalcin [Holotrichia oblita]